MIFSRRKYSGNVVFTLNTDVLDFVDDCKYLSDTFSRMGTFKKCRDDYVLKGTKSHV